MAALIAGLDLLEPSPQALTFPHFVSDSCHDDANDCSDSENSKYGSQKAHLSLLQFCQPVGEKFIPAKI